MTKYDIKLRRKTLTKGQIGRHKDFKSLYASSPIEQKSTIWVKLVVIGVAVALILGMAVFGIIRISKQNKTIENVNPDQELFEEFKTE